MSNTTTNFRKRLKSLIEDSKDSMKSIKERVPNIEGIINGCEEATVNDLSTIVEILDIPPYRLFLQNNNFFEKYDISVEELEDMINNNGSFRGSVVGYLAEKKLRQIIESTYPEITIIGKPDDHDRKEKCDLIIEYNGSKFRIEVKSLQTNSIKKSKNARYKLSATVQCDASDCRPVELPNGKTVTTTCLIYGGFDVLAVNMYMFDHKWEFAFALNSKLPHSKYKGKNNIISDDALRYLMKTSIPISYPIDDPFEKDLCKLLDELINK